MNDLMLLRWLIVAVMGVSAGIFWSLMVASWKVRAARWLFGLWAVVVTATAVYMFLVALGVFTVGPFGPAAVGVP